MSLDTTLRIAEIGALICLMAFLVAAEKFLVQATADEHQVAESSLKVEAKLTATLTDVRRVVLIAGGTANEIRHTSIVTRKAAADERVQIHQAMAALVKIARDGDSTVLSLKSTVDGLNRNVNGRLLPQATMTIGNINRQFSLLAGDAHKNLQKLAKTQDNLAWAAEGLAATANDPNIAKTFANVEGMTADGHAITHHYREILTAPKNIFWQLLHLFGPAADGAQIYSAVH